MLLKGRIQQFQRKTTATAVDRAVETLVGDAYQHIPRFRERLDQAYVRPSEIRTALDLRRLPIATRKDYLSVTQQDNLRRGTDPDRCYRVRTSGTSGMPLIVHMNRYESFYRRYRLLAALRRGAHLSMPLSIAEIGASSLRPDCRRSGIMQRFGLVHVHRISRLLSSEEQANRLLQEPFQVITGEPSCLELAAEALQKMGKDVAVRPRLVALRGEILPPQTRALLRQVFQCTVLDYYSCEEVGNIAWECPAEIGVFHINTDACLVEIVDEQGNSLPAGVEGSVVITNLFNRTMPFIRYQLGDRAVLLEPTQKPCICGHRGPTMAVLAGRADDFITLPSGRRVSPRSMVDLICTASRCDQTMTSYYVSQFRVEQQSLTSIRVFIVPAIPVAPNLLRSRITEAVGSLHPDLRVDVEIVDTVPMHDAAKLRFIVSRVHPPT